MYPSAYDLKGFYNTLGGRIIRRIIRERILEFWPDTHGQRVMGVGYAAPYLKPFLDNSERVFAVMPGGIGAHDWPEEQKNLVCVSAEHDLPLETNSVDRILMIHSLEFSGFYKPSFEELWRVMKSSGRILIIVPNRMGLWARADWSPFGQGTPMSAHQVENFLRDNLFVHERTEKALFVPPFRSTVFLRSAGYFEKFGRTFLPAIGGVHIVEASKQLYAGTGKLARSPVQARKASASAPEPAG